ncbi:MAG: hypothetical protein ABIT71_02650, partial [Vicinamibacteraceae bacterium]
MQPHGASRRSASLGRGLIIVGCLCAAGPAAVHAQSTRDAAPIAPDRPGFGTPPTVVDPGLLQIEIGASLSHDGARREVAAPQALWRTGIGHRTELRLESDGFVWARDGGRS